MRAAVLIEPNRPLEVLEVDLEAPDPDQVRVAVAACGVCHSDVSLVNGTFPIMGPTVPGHEAAGVVTEVGSGVTHLSVGDHVVLSPNPACGHCRSCRRGRPGACAETAALMTSTFPDGSTKLSRGGEVLYRGLGLAGWATEVVVSGNGAVAIADDVPLDVACVIGCAVQTGVGAALNTASIEPGDSVLVVGAGGIGVSIAAGAAIAGATRAIVSDPSEARREQAHAVRSQRCDRPDPDRCRGRGEPARARWCRHRLRCGRSSAALIDTCLAATCNGERPCWWVQAHDRLGVGQSGDDDVRGEGIKGSLLGSSLASRDILDWWNCGARVGSRSIRWSRPGFPWPR